MKALVTGAHGFIGRHLMRRLAADGHEARAFDRPQDVRVASQLVEAMGGVDVVFHLAALADVRHALTQSSEQVEANLMLTLHVLDAMRATGVGRIVFTSTAVVYGDCTESPITERATCFPQQTSVYGAMKLASESLIAAYCRGYGMTGDVLRLVSLVGAGYTHGNLFDFYQKLKASPTRLEIYGTGQQQKYYVHVADVIDALLLVAGRDHPGTCELWNVSHDQPNTINDAIAAVCAAMHAQPEIIHAADPWAGDLPGLVLDCTKLKALGWQPRVPIMDGMRAAVRDFMERHL